MGLIDNPFDPRQERVDLYRRLSQLNRTGPGLPPPDPAGEVTFDTGDGGTAPGGLASAFVATGLSVSAPLTVTSVAATLQPYGGAEYRFECWRMVGTELVEKVGATSVTYSQPSSKTYSVLSFPTVSWPLAAGSTYALILVGPGVFLYWVEGMSNPAGLTDLAIPGVGSIVFGNYYLYSSDDAPPSVGQVLVSDDVSRGVGSPDLSRPSFDVTVQVGAA